MGKIVIIPDIHGRTFWKSVVKLYKNEDIIFLGDYLDPYGYEGITPIQAIDNFKEILEFAKTHDNVTLLLGNHDFGGYINDEMPKCRFDYDNFIEIKKLFADNLSLFKMIVFREINGKTVSFSHSVIGSGWIKSCKKFDNNISSKEVANLLNSALAVNNQEFLTDCLYHISRYRGGWGLYGSVVWADVNEADIRNNLPEDIDYQVFGHSQQEYEPIITDKYACLDVRQGFTIDDNLNIELI